MAVLGAPIRAALADPPSATAKEHYERGRKNYNLGHYEEALQDFEQAYQSKDDPAFLFNIAQCRRNTHRYEDAERSYRAYLRENTSIDNKTREQVQKLIAEMDKAIEDQRTKQPPMGTQPPISGDNAETSSAPPAKPATPSISASSPSQPETAFHPNANEDLLRSSRTKTISGIAVAAIGLGAVVGGIVCGVLVTNASDKLTQLAASRQPFDYNQEQRGKTDRLLEGIFSALVPRPS